MPIHPQRPQPQQQLRQQQSKQLCVHADENSTRALPEGGHKMNQDAVFFGVIISVAGAFAVMVWLLYMIYRNATKGDNGK